MIGWLLGAAITYTTIKGACNYAGQKGQKAYPSLNRNDFDQSNMIKGFGEFNEEKSNRSLHVAVFVQMNMVYCHSLDMKTV